MKTLIEVIKTNLTSLNRPYKFFNCVSTNYKNLGPYKQIYENLMTVSKIVLYSQFTSFFLIKVIGVQICH